MRRWGLLPVISADMPFQMALDEILLEQLRASASEVETLFPKLRLYYSSSPWTTIGYTYRESIASHDHPVCRRITGGGRVDHGNDLLISLIALKKHDPSFGSVRESYFKIHAAIRDALETCGLQIDFYCTGQDYPRGPDCFVYPIETDLSYQGQKIAGGAQKRSQGLMLHQESIQLRLIPAVPDLENAILAGFKKIFEVQFDSCDLIPETLSQAHQLAVSKYYRNDEVRRSR